MAAADTGRRQLEERLSAATGDRLARLDVQARAAAGEARGAGAPRTAALLEPVIATVDDAQRGFADLAAGLYPHQLTQDGLAAVLLALPARMTLPITCDIEEIDRLPEDIEVALWFTALEALQNASKHSQGAPARLTLRRTGAWWNSWSPTGDRGSTPPPRRPASALRTCATGWLPSVGRPRSAPRREQAPPSGQWSPTGERDLPPPWRRAAGVTPAVVGVRWSAGGVPSRVSSWSATGGG